jgi:hypothetical protein
MLFEFEIGLWGFKYTFKPWLTGAFDNIKQRISRQIRRHLWNIEDCKSVALVEMFD